MQKCPGVCYLSAPVGPQAVIKILAVFRAAKLLYGWAFCDWAGQSRDGCAQRSTTSLVVNSPVVVGLVGFFPGSIVSVKVALAVWSGEDFH